MCSGSWPRQLRAPLSPVSSTSGRHLLASLHLTPSALEAAARSAALPLHDRCLCCVTVYALTCGGTCIAQTVDMLARAIQAQSQQVPDQSCPAREPALRSTRVGACCPLTPRTAPLPAHFASPMQIKDLRAKVEELEKRGSRDNVANEQEWQAFQWLFDRVPDGDGDDEVRQRVCVCMHACLHACARERRATITSAFGPLLPLVNPGTRTRARAPSSQPQTHTAAARAHAHAPTYACACEPTNSGTRTHHARLRMRNCPRAFVCRMRVRARVKSESESPRLLRAKARWLEMAGPSQILHRCVCVCVGGCRWRGPREYLTGFFLC